MLVLLLACSNAKVLLDEDTGADLDGTPSDDNGGETNGGANGGDDTGDPPVDTSPSESGGEESGEDHSEWDDATLVILEPESGDFLPYGQASPFTAVVYDAAGNATTFDEITWTSDVDASWGLTGGSLEDASLDVGTHALTATARLPNGDRLAYTVGGVLVQSELTGVYTGTLSITLGIDSYSAGCAGGATFEVDAYGEQVTGEATCLLSLQGYELDTSWVFDYAIAEESLDGVAGADLTWFTYDFDSTGAVTSEGLLTGEWADDVYGYLTVDGSFEAERVSREVPTE